MKFVIQRVSNASCTVEGNITGSIQKGFLVLIGISDQDTIQIADKMIKKLLGMRIFEDSDGKTNLSLHDVNGELLLISQFTLYAVQTAGKETVHPLQTQENLIWQSKCTNISLISAKKKFRLLNRESLALT